jgi:DNA polymerase elongation subunit (family B)
MLPMEYGQVARVGPASKIESLFVREYLRRRQSLPRSEWGSQSHGGYTDIFFTGITGPVVYADVESLYPSIMLNYGIRPDRDALGLFPDLLRRLTTLRLDSKQAMRDAGTTELKSALDARQNSYKIVINSFYGYLGFSGALFNDYSEADRVATTGQDILLSIMRLIVQRGGTLVEVDTDGVLFVPPESVTGEDAERAFLEALNEEMPEGIRIGFDGRYARILSYKKKNYALRDHAGSTKMKGSALVSRSIEPFGRRFVRSCVFRLLDEDINGLHETYLQIRDQITEHRWEHASDFCRTDTLRDSLEVYHRDVSAGKRTRSAVYELAREHNERGSHQFRKGDRISWYVGGSTASGPAFELARLASEWDLSTPDENTAFYLKRLDELASRFEPFFAPSDFRTIFSPEDLFGFDASSINLVGRTFPVPDSFAPELPPDDDDEEF